MQHAEQYERWDASGIVPQLPATGLMALMHDTRNLVASIVLYCDLIDEPGVLSPSARQYGTELRLVAKASQRLLEAIVAIASQNGQALPTPPIAQPLDRIRRLRMDAGDHPVESLAGELKANLSLLQALSGPRIAISVAISGGSEPVALSTQNLSRILINLTRNAAEAMAGKGRIHIALEETGLAKTTPLQAGIEPAGPGPSKRRTSSRSQKMLRLTFSDSGPGIPASALEAVFSPGYTTHFGAAHEVSGTAVQDAGAQASFSAGPDSEADEIQPSSPAAGRGLGLSIVRSLAVSAGGSVRAVHRAVSRAVSAAQLDSLAGATIVLEFPVLSLQDQPAQNHAAETEANAPWRTPGNGLPTGGQAAT